MSVGSRFPVRMITGHLVTLVVLLGCAGFVGTASAQRDLPPEKGGETYSLGMPPVYKGRSGFELQWYRPQNNSELAGFYNLGLSKDLGSPVVGIAALRLEGYVGLRNQNIDGGGRALFEIPSFFVGGGIDYNGSDDVWDFLLTLDLPLRRGGVFGRGTTLALRWLPARDQTFGVGINVPLWGRNIGATRPMSDNVSLDYRDPFRLELELQDQLLKKSLTDLRERAHWLAMMTQPFAEPEGADAAEAMAPVLAGLKAHIDSTDSGFPRGHTLPEEITAYHETLDLAFSLAAGDRNTTDAGRATSIKARAILLDEVLVPYNYLLGQRKRHDSLISMIAIAQTEFASWVLTDAKANDQHANQIFYVFQTLCDVMEENRALLRERWDDSRFVWLPLQYALTPDQHDSQAELDDIIAKSSKQPFTEENRVWYVINEQFQWEMVRSVRKAEDYHVLWIHDFRGLNGEGKPDAVAYAQTLNYLEAMIERVSAYDETGKLPQYFILLDQHYFEINKARLWLRLLSAPLDYEMSLPKGFEDWEQRLKETQDRLRQAVSESMLLQVAQSQYGEKWLKNLIKVHVNITNPADPSFFSWHSVGIMPIPDNMMRDHRKIAFYDITEEDPFRGMAMFTGMGIGEHYIGPNWEDRAIMIQGPGALAVKDAAHGLLMAQGYEPGEMPYPLRKISKPVNYGRILAAEHRARNPDWLDHRGSVMQLHNETGFHDKPVNAAKAVLYSLMPPGSVLKVPDSLWQSYIYASLLAGSAQRGCKVLVIAPTLDSAPSGAAPTLARAHGLMGRLIVFSNEMDDALTESGGLLEVGLYAPKQGVGDIAGRFKQADEARPSWVREIYPRNPVANAELKNVGALLDSLGYSVSYLSGDSAEVKPKIHLKANFFASGTAWKKLMERPELGTVLRAHIEYLAMQAAPNDTSGSPPDVQDIPEDLKAGWIELMHGLLDDLTPAEKDELIYYFSVGSTNMDYRSMVMDGEVMVLLGGWQGLYGFMDFLLLPGLCEWLETTGELDALLPPPSGMTRALAGLMKLTL
jgi:hypothetical protein